MYFENFYNLMLFALLFGATNMESKSPLSISTLYYIELQSWKVNMKDDDVFY